MGLFKNKKKEETLLDKLSVINSPVIEKIYNFSVNKVDLQKEIDKKRSRIADLRTKLENAEKDYTSSGFDEKVLKESAKIKTEITELETMAYQQERVLTKHKNGPKMALTEEEKQSLIKGFAPVRAKQDELYQEFLEKYAALEETLIQLNAEREKTAEVLRDFGSILRFNTDEGHWYYDNFVRFPLGEMNFKLMDLNNYSRQENWFHLLY